MGVITLPASRKLTFLPDDFRITTWARLKPYYDELLKRPIESTADLEKWILDRNEMGAVIDEDFGWRYIRLTQNSEDEKALELYQYAMQELSPRIASLENQLNRKLVASPFADALDSDKYFIHLRGIRNEVELFREENVPLLTESELKSKTYGALLSKITVEVDGKSLTLQQAGTLLEQPERLLRESVYHKINRRMLEDREALDSLFDELLKLRHQIALNAGFDNYRDYKFRAMGRFDYTPDDCYDFHDSIASEVLPVVDELYRFRKEALGLDSLRPWDLVVDASGKAPLKPFDQVHDLTKKSIEALSGLHPYFGECLTMMKEMGRLDLDSRKGKHPGGYNMPLVFSGVPFIFMNATTSINDLHTLMHEAGHAVHSFLTRDYDLTSAKHMPSEVAELASMSMELLSMDHWDHFFGNGEDLRRAKIFQLEGVLKTLPWVAAVDKFQHWLYTHPGHSKADRNKAWTKISDEFTPALLDRTGLEAYYRYQWHKQLHLFEVPFYYIEYGMAQLGAIAIWKRFRENPDQALEDYILALRLGFTKPIGEIYKVAGIEFHFGKSYVRELAIFVKKELENIL